MKRTNKWVLLLLAVLVLAALCVFAASAETVGGYCGRDTGGTNIAWEYDTETQTLTGTVSF